MSKLISYLTFNGNCRQAMHFYQNCLGGQLYIQSVSESPLAEALPHRIKNLVLHSLLENENMVLMGTDMVDEEGLTRGNALSLLLDCSSKKEANHYYARLAEEGKATHPLTENIQGALFGGLTDKFGNQWLFLYRKRSSSHEETLPVKMVHNHILN